MTAQLASLNAALIGRNKHDDTQSMRFIQGRTAQGHTVYPRYTRCQSLSSVRPQSSKSKSSPLHSVNTKARVRIAKTLRLETSLNKILVRTAKEKGVTQQYLMEKALKSLLLNEC